ncbi:MAG TPA: magnesium chelatase [Thermodesulfobacteriota bacterium]|nr:magnesium chelatase [Thermodesulfobacteriota bacterium]
MEQKPRTIAELKASEYKVLSVKEEMRKNLIQKLRLRENVFSDIIGYEESVIPQIETAILAGHDLIFLGERGQAKTRLIRSLIKLLDKEVPAIKGCEINDSPYAPVCKSCRDKINELGDNVDISWISYDSRYGEKLATPDVSIADLIGEVDPIKVAEGRYLSDELTIHFGLILRTNRGIFAINELPDLVEKVQVGLFNIMEEKDVQIKGYKIRLPLDMCIVATANPEDYTNRGRIITPLKDRFQAQIRTHYPSLRDTEIKVMEQEARVLTREGYTVKVPKFIKEIISEITFQARGSHEINQRSGVSVRITIANYESITAAAEKRAIKLGEREVAPRITDFPALIPSTVGKIELEYLGEDVSEVGVVENLIKRAVKTVFDSYFPSLNGFSDLLESFEHGYVEVADNMSSEEYLVGIKEVKGLKKCIEALKIEQTPAQIASATEFILEGLHLSNKLNKENVRGKIIYK